jgi:hypothetical protein
MTANQTVALLFPLLAAGAAALTAVMIVRPWAVKKKSSTTEFAISEVSIHDQFDTNIQPMTAEEMVGSLDRADELLKRVQRQLRAS